MFGKNRHALPILNVLIVFLIMWTEIHLGNGLMHILIWNLALLISET